MMILYTSEGIKYLKMSFLSVYLLNLKIENSAILILKV
jgi:hypothetical protein